MQQRGTYNVESVRVNPAAILEANLAHTKFDVYDNRETSEAHVVPQPPNNWPGFAPSCPLGSKVRQCYQAALPGLAQQGVNGVRFFFSICGLENSTALVGPDPEHPDVGNCWSPDPTQVVRSQTWVDNVTDFFQDLKDAGISRITINPLLSGGERVIPVADPCTNQQQELVFSPVAPWGFEKGRPPDCERPDEPWCHGNPWGGFTDASKRNSYNCSPANPVFVGWDKIKQVIEGVLDAAKSKNLVVTELEL